MNRRQLDRRNQSFTPGIDSWVDGEDPFAGGHQVKRPGGRASHSERLGRIPEWAKDNKQIQALLLRSFPKLETDHNQRRRAAIWAQIIQLYYRAVWTQAKIAEEMGLTPSAVNSTIRSIARAAEGRQSGTGKDRKLRRIIL
jgi:hypothetical protein